MALKDVLVDVLITCPGEATIVIAAEHIDGVVIRAAALWVQHIHQSSHTHQWVRIWKLQADALG
jgi:hypothetical protein